MKFLVKIAFIILLLCSLISTSFSYDYESELRAIDQAINKAWSVNDHNKLAGLVKRRNDLRELELRQADTNRPQTPTTQPTQKSAPAPLPETEYDIIRHLWNQGRFQEIIDRNSMRALSAKTQQAQDATSLCLKLFAN